VGPGHCNLTFSIRKRIVRLQEIVEFNVGTVMLYTTDSAARWEEHITAQLTERHGAGAYTRVSEMTWAPGH
jgi:hypothetical protein